MTEPTNVPVDEPGWWYADTNTALEYALAPAAWVYGAVARARLHQPCRHKSRLPVVCIGNFTAGGTGKTPLTRLIAEWLTSAGQPPCILTRGYGGRLPGPHKVDPARDVADDVGDEALLLAGAYPVCLARDRAAGSQAIETRNRERVIIMDDGLQNPALRKDFRIAIVDATRGLGNRRVIPSGPLRAPLRDQLAKVDCIILNRGFRPERTGGDVREHGSVGWLRNHFAGPILSARVVPDGDLDGLRSKPVVAYAGIANPRRFFDLLAESGIELRDQIAFRDHQMLTDADARRLLDLAHREGAVLATTEKDFVRLPKADNTGPLAELKRATCTIPIRLQFEPADEDWLKAELRRIITLARDAKT
jgi:tetraacyldisaccharide 4'-kinase